MLATAHVPLEKPYSHISHKSDLITDPKLVARLLNVDEKTARGLVDLDRGPPGGKMQTLGLQHVVNKSEQYIVTPEGLKAASILFPIDLEERVSNPRHIEKPSYLEIEAIWDTTPLLHGDGNNILGDNCNLFFGEKELKIPIVQATDATLAYYGATLIEQGDELQFQTDLYPLFRMNIEQSYVADFIMSDAGGGLYLEYHNDKPHFHLNVKGEGFYLLAKWNENRSKLQITGFQIPHGQGVYTKGGGIHCDSCLIGDWLVGYTVAHDFSTASWKISSENPSKVGLIPVFE